MKVRAAAFLLPAVVLAGCGGSLSTADGGSGTAGAGGAAGTAGGGGTMGTGGSGAPADAATPFDAAAIPPDLRAQLDAAASTWAAGKGSCSIYSYDRRWMSVFGGGGSTEVEIRNDTATRRRQSVPSSAVDGGAARVDAGGWTVIWDETGGDVGSHPTSWNTFAPSTMEQLLAECGSVLARDPAENTLRLVVDGHGVPTTCTYFPSGCFDDCLVGITIVGFACAPLAN